MVRLYFLGRDLGEVATSTAAVALGIPEAQVTRHIIAYGRIVRGDYRAECIEAGTGLPYDIRFLVGRDF